MTQILIYFGAVTGATLIGGFTPLWFQFTRRRLKIGLNFSSGILIGASFLQLIPEAFEVMGAAARVPILAGFLAIFLLEKFFLVHSCEEQHCAFHSIGIPAFVGISLHSLSDGLALGAGLMIPGMGLIIVLALIFHKMPDAFSLTSILVAANYTKKQIVTLLVIFSCTTPIGAMLALYGLKRIDGNFLGWAIGISAGTFLAVATSDLIGQIHAKDEERFTSIAALIAGIALAWVGRMLHGHA